MKINIAQNLKNSKGKDLVVEDNGKKEKITVKKIMIEAALSNAENDTKNKEGDFEVFLKISNEEKEIDLSTPEISRLLEKIRKGFSTLVHGQMNYILEGKENPIKEKK